MLWLSLLNVIRKCLQVNTLTDKDHSYKYWYIIKQCESKGCKGFRKSRHLLDDIWVFTG